MWIAPNFATVASIAALTCASSATSVFANSALPAPNAATVACPVSSFMSRIATLPPRATNASHAPRPMPDAPPVTTATLPLISIRFPIQVRSKCADAEDVAPDDELLDLGRPIGDRHDPGVAVMPFHAVVLGDAESAVDLHCFRRDPHAHLRRVPLGHRGLGVAAYALLQHCRRPMAEQTRGVELGGHFGD